jgi:hypothetical protein
VASSWGNVPQGPYPVPELDRQPEHPDALGEFEGAHPVTRTDVDPVQLQEDLVRTLGQDVTVSMRMPTEDAAGYVRVQDVNSGLDLNVDPALLDSVIAENAPPETNAQRFLREFDAAAEVNTRLMAVRNYIARDVAEESHQVGVRRRRQNTLTRRLEAQIPTQNTVNPATGEPVTIQTL